MLNDDVTDRMGVYKRLADVPDDRRFKKWAGSYEGRDVWAEFVDKEYRAPTYRELLERAGRYWKEFMEPRGRHHALGRPDDVETYMTEQRDLRADKTTFDAYWRPLNMFYTWLMWHADHQHAYQPVWMAVNEYPNGATAYMWRQQRREVEKVNDRRIRDPEGD